MRRPCGCDNCKIGEPWAKPQCRHCWLYHNDDRYKKLWHQPALPKPIVKAQAAKVKKDCGCKKHK